MKKRFLLPLLLLFLPATIISAAYAGFVYSNKVDTKTDSNSGKIDDVKPNFKLDENNYTIYFFPSMQAVDLNFNNDFSEANIRSKIDGATNKESDKWGQWLEDDSYYPKKIETHGGPSISLHQFENIGEPYSKDNDNYNSWITKYILQFSGWTADKQAAKNGYKSQGDYNYISAFDDLTKIDDESKDGTNAKDKIIFVYPIFTTGKAYNEEKNNNIVKLTASKPDPTQPSGKKTKPRYLSRVVGEENSTYFYYRNLVINKNESWTWDLSFAGQSSSRAWYSDWPYYRSGGSSETPSYYIYKSNFDNSLIKEAGIYNIYAYLQRKNGKNAAFDEKAANTSLFSTEINSNLLPLIYEDNFSNPDFFKTSLGTWLGGHTFWLFVKIEKVYEFRLAGTEGRGFTFDTAGQLYVSHFDSSNFKTLEDSNGVSASTKYPSLNNGLWKMYYLDNVFMEKGKNNLFTEYINPSNKKIYKIRNNVFSILPSNESLSGITSGLQAMGDTSNPTSTLAQELSFLNDFEPDLNVKGNYLGASDASFNRIDSKHSPENYIKDPRNMPNYSNEYSRYFFASEFKYSGFCKVLIKVDFGTFGEFKGKPISIHVAVAPYLSNKHKIYVYPEFYKNGEPFDFSYYIDNETKLIDPENNAKLMKHQITSFEVLASNDYQLDGNQDISVVGTSGTMKLSKYLSDYEILDHLTNARIIISGSKPKSYRRHMACWQKGLFSQYNKE